MLRRFAAAWTRQPTAFAKMSSVRMFHVHSDKPKTTIYEDDQAFKDYLNQQAFSESEDEEKPTLRQSHTARPPQSQPVTSPHQDQP